MATQATAPQGFNRQSPFALTGGKYTPAQREQIEKSFIIKTLPVQSVGSSGFRWKWVETRTFPDNGHTYDVVGVSTWDGNTTADIELWFDATDVLAPAERGPLALRANTVPAVKPSIAPAGQVATDYSWVLPTLAIAGVLTAFTAYELATRPAPLALPPIRPLRRRRR